ncbi:Sugary1 [Zea mays]|nr:Sugary1 [Zea mays]
MAQQLPCVSSPRPLLAVPAGRWRAGVRGRPNVAGLGRGRLSLHAAAARPVAEAVQAEEDDDDDDEEVAEERFALGGACRVLAGMPAPLGATALRGGVNFAVYSSGASAASLCLFAPGDLKAHTPVLKWTEFSVFLLHGMLYGYRFDGVFAPERGQYYDVSNVVVDPYAKAVVSRGEYGVPAPGGSCWPQMAGMIPLPYNKFDWQGDLPLGYHQKDLVIYEMHLRGFTKHNSSKTKHPGTYIGAVSKLDHLKELGVNCIELMPCHEFNELEYFSSSSKMNFWGYSTINFFSPMARYSSSGIRDSGCGAINEFKAFVREAHKRGIEVIMDVVFNHTAEGNEKGPILSFRGIDNSTYYMLAPKGEFYNYSGCGNTFNCNHPVVREFIVDCLRYWVTEMHVDGFRFDLASILTRGCSSLLKHGMQEVSIKLVSFLTGTFGQSGMERDLKLFKILTLVSSRGKSVIWSGKWIQFGIMDGTRIYVQAQLSNRLRAVWGQVPVPVFKLLKKLAPRNLSLGYLDLIILFFVLEKLGSERPTLRTSQPNCFYYRDTVRQFIKGTDGFAGAFAECLCGSPQLYQAGGRKPWHSINFVCAHDGFTLADLVTYNSKYNLSNGEDNRDGENHNLSWNCGEEGEFASLSVRRLRKRQMRNFFVCLMVSQGVPMFYMGDEYGHTKGGNNNTYCHDHYVNYFRWDKKEEQSSDLYRFCRLMTKFRKECESLGLEDFPTSERLKWHGHQPGKPDWSEASRFVAFTMKDETKGEIYVAFNTSHLPVVVGLPERSGFRWEPVVDTGKEAPYDFLTDGLPDRAVTVYQFSHFLNSNLYPMLSYSSIILVLRPDV